MSSPIPYLTDCHLRNGPDDAPRNHKCRAAVWASDAVEARERLAMFIESTPYRLIWSEECVEAVEYIRRHGRQNEVGALARAVHAGHLVELGPLDTEEVEAKIQTFREALLALDYKAAPVFAVLDGAQFDHLPDALFDGDFIARSLYLDRGENDPDQVITAPHMVILDERTEKVTGRPYKETVDTLFTLIDDKPAAVFWQCEHGADALYKHLRSINMVLYPKEALDDWEEPEPEDGIPEESPDTHTLVLFRHADANGMAQVLGCASDTEQLKLFGPAQLMMLAPAEPWRDGQDYLSAPHPTKMPALVPGSLRLSDKTIECIGGAHLGESRRKIKEYLRDAAPDHAGTISAKELDTLINDAEKIGDRIGLESEHAHGLWALLALITGGEVLVNSTVLAHFEQKGRPADDLITEIVDQIANASNDDLEAL